MEKQEEEGEYFGKKRLLHFVRLIGALFPGDNELLDAKNGHLDLDYLSILRRYLYFYTFPIVPR